MRFFYLLVPFVLFNTSVIAGETDGEYDCDGTGLRIVGDIVQLGETTYKLCRTEGVVYKFARKDCKTGAEFYSFDEVTHRLIALYAVGKWQCKKIK